MLESLHAFHCDIWCLQGAQTDQDEVTVTVNSAIMHIGFFYFHGISLERSGFRKIALLFFRLA